MRSCYPNRITGCMKHLNPHNDSDATIEHCIPRSTPQGKTFTDYFSLCYPGLNASNVCHTENYKNGTSIPGQYPHHVAYHNFAVACHECNENRGNQFIGIPFLLPIECQHIGYNRTTGKVNWYDDPKIFDGSPETEYMVNRVGLNRPVLKAMRAVWFYGKDHPTDTYSTPDTVHDERERRELIYRTFGAAVDTSPDFDMQDLNGFLALDTHGFWKIVLKYDYFASI